MSHEDDPVHRVRCPVHGFIKLSERERRIVDHPLLQRLRHVRQLSLACYVFPGAMHSRLEHSLGALEVASRIFDQLALRSPDLLRQALDASSELGGAALRHARALVRLAGLIHDVGHAAFSHGAQAVLCPDGHERLTAWALRSTDLGDAVERHYGPGSAAIVARLALGEFRGTPLAPLQDIVAGVLDADRTDYLLRDSLHCGVEYGRFDHRRLIECLELAPTDAGPRLALARDGLHAFEAMILARHQMTTQVYQHRVRRIYDRYLAEYLRTHHPDGPPSPGEVLAGHDVGWLARILDDARDPSTARGRWAARIAGRRHHRRVFETGKYATNAEVSRARAMMDALAARHPELELVYDEPSSELHDLAPHGEGASLRLTGGGRPAGEVVDESPILRAIPRRCRCARIYADVRDGDTDGARAWRPGLTEEARALWVELGG